MFCPPCTRERKICDIESSYFHILEIDKQCPYRISLELFSVYWVG